ANRAPAAFTPPAPRSLSAPANVVSGNAFTLSGRAIAGATITLYDNGVLVTTGPIVADGSGNWSVSLTLSSVATHSLTAVQTVAGVASAASSAVSVKVWAPPVPPAIATP